MTVEAIYGNLLNAHAALNELHHPINAPKREELLPAMKAVADAIRSLGSLSRAEAA